MSELLTKPAPSESLHAQNEKLAESLKILEYEKIETIVSAADPALLYELGLDRLPAGVAIMGGAARAILLGSRYGDYDAAVRDVDLVVVDELASHTIDFAELSREYMPDDYAHGYGVGSTPIDAYFSTRDFTINEVLVVDGVIISSRQCDEDLRKNTIRASEYEIESNGTIGPKLKAKALLLAAVFKVQYGYAEDKTPRSWGGGEFYTALMINKAFQYGEAVTIQFMADLGFDQDKDLYQAAVEYALAYAKDDEQFSFRGSEIADDIMKYVFAERGEQPEESDQDMLQSATELLYAYRRHLPRGLTDEY